MSVSMSDFTNFYKDNQQLADKGFSLAENLLDSFIKKKSDKPSAIIAPTPTITQVMGASSKDKTLIWVAGGVGVLLVVAILVFRK